MDSFPRRPPGSAAHRRARRLRAETRTITRIVWAATTLDEHHCSDPGLLAGFLVDLQRARRSRADRAAHAARDAPEAPQPSDLLAKHSVPRPTDAHAEH
eukprot:8235220-Heterocapsa_arctica.AAC.1